MKFWKRIVNFFVQDVPPDIEACAECRETDCSQYRFETCPRRIAAVALVKEVGETE